jgi:hypothetical protein
MKSNIRKFDKAIKNFFPESGIWYSNCFLTAKEIDRSNLPCHLRNNLWMSRLMKSENHWILVRDTTVKEYLDNSELFNVLRHDYELRIVEWQTKHQLNDGEGWIVNDQYGGDFYMFHQDADKGFRLGIKQTLEAINMDKEVIEEGIEKYRDLWFDKYINVAFRNIYAPILSFCNGDRSEPKEELRDAWTRVRKYDYYQEHKESVDKYGTILPEMKMTFDEVAMLRYYIEMEGSKRIEELERRRQERENKRFARIKGE